VGTPGGSGVSDLPIKFANQIQAWKAPHRTFRFLESLRRTTDPVPITDHNSSQSPDAPLSALQGECLYDTNSLFCYDGTQKGQKVTLVLWKFALTPTPGDFGQGRVMLGDKMPAGDLYWAIIVPPATGGLPSFGSWSGSTEQRRLLRR
jgi:hypothetical protein